MENDENTNPPPETRPRPSGETSPLPQSEVERRSLAHTLAESYLDGTAKAAGVATVAAIVHGAGKVKDAHTSKDDGPKVILPPGTNSKD